jgi:predicted RNA-binding protein with PIN domain
MRWLIDGYNVIRRDPDLRAREEESLEAGRAALLHLVARTARESRDDFTIVFDGARVSGGRPSAGQVQVVFSRPPRTADDELIRLAREHGAGTVVVSSDRKIQDAARRSRCAVITAEQFLQRLPAESEPHRQRLPAESEPHRAYSRPPTAQAGLADPATKDEDEPPRDKRGNPRRLSKEARAAQRALRRLRFS